MSTHSRGKTPAAVQATAFTHIWPAIALFALTIIAYLPAFSAGFIWDDPDYVINNVSLRSPGGLADIWLQPRLSPQYYPLVFTTFWIEFQLWGLNASGYHAVNVLMHAGSAVLLWALLRRINLPGAWLGAAIFAVHPVHVESVAWITERKNVLSGLFYLASLLAYFRGSGVSPEPFQATRNHELGRDAQATFLRPLDRYYLLSLGLFICALLSKTVTCSLPAAILLIIWWREGRIRMKRDILPLIPFFAIGALLALNTARLERGHVGAIGAEWDYSAIERCLIAGNALWFYLWKIVWPVDLAFIYPKWEIDSRNAVQFIFPIMAILLVVLLFLLRRRIGRGPLVAALFFGGTLLPALGFINVYPMRYSFVADHFQYLASLGPIVVIATVLWRIAKPRAALIVVLAPLVVLTFMQARHYASAETLWRDTLTKNSRSWMVHTNLANALADQRRFDEAFEHYQRAAELGDELPETHWNLGAAFERRGEFGAAFSELDRATQIDPSFPAPYYVRGNIYFKQGKLEEAKAEARRALEIAPEYADAHYLLGRIAEQENRADNAIAHYLATVTNSFGNADAHYNLGNLLFAGGRFDEALIHHSQAVRLRPNWAEAHANLGATLLKLKRVDEAIVAFEAALRIDPNLAPARRNLENARVMRNRAR